MKKNFLILMFSLIGMIGLGIKVYAERNPVLPPPYETPSVPNPSTVIGWPEGKMPVAPEGFMVSVFAELASPRSLYLLESGDVVVSQAKRTPDDGGAESPNQITYFKMTGSQMESSFVLLKDLNFPFGMTVWENEFYVGEPERVLAFPFDGEKITGPSRLVATLPFPEPKRHWTRHLLMANDGSKLYVSVGSVSNVGEAPDPLDPRTAAILQMNRDGSGEKIFAGGLRNAVSMAWEPKTARLWAAVNERDELGDFVPPDYITHVQEDGFYGWPYAYWGKNEDPRRKGERPDLVEKSIQPDFSVGAHTAALGITFTTGTKVPAPYNEGALVALHGSWNSSSLVGYKVLFVPFKDGEAIDGEKDFLTGFIADLSKSTVYGRPVSTLVLTDGSILVADDAGNRIWKVTPPPEKKR
ncbi:PQQ-dependent sugar dehydrogenase [Bdellovibrio sp. HCB2-146]|uniref:PQQ-dependent sugar dehydrogenase n=1 Tax=Bdellovibrio sp. HCB2-146 TaxID=3394362 RepID=UPI0039BD86CF